jgi:hypothetical protein
MSATDNSSNGKPGVKTLAIRLEPDVHAQLSFIAQLKDSTITDEFRQAILNHIEACKADPELTAKAGGVLDDIEREAQTRREAIASLFGSAEPAPTKETTGRKARSGEDSSAG